MEHMLLEGFLGRFQQPLAGSGDTTREDDSLRIDHRGIVGESEAQGFTCAAECLNGHRIALVTHFCNHSWRQLRHTAHLSRLGRLSHHLTGRTDDTLRGRIGFQTAFVATATQTTVMLHTRVSYLSSIAVRTQLHASVGIKTTT